LVGTKGYPILAKALVASVSVHAGTSAIAAARTGVAAGGSKTIAVLYIYNVYTIIYIYMHAAICIYIYNT